MKDKDPTLSFMRRHGRQLAVGTAVLALGGAAIGTKVAAGGSNEKAKDKVSVAESQPKSAADLLLGTHRVANVSLTFKGDTPVYDQPGANRHAITRQPNDIYVQAGIPETVDGHQYVGYRFTLKPVTSVEGLAQETLWMDETENPAVATTPLGQAAEIDITVNNNGAVAVSGADAGQPIFSGAELLSNDTGSDITRNH